mgnify:CR=1 FL=1
MHPATDQRRHGGDYDDEGAKAVQVRRFMQDLLGDDVLDVRAVLVDVAHGGGNDAGDTVNVSYTQAAPGLANLTVNGDSGDDTLNINDEAATAGRSFTIDATSISIGGTQIQHISVSGSDVTMDASFKITEALAIFSPGAEGIDDLRGYDVDPGSVDTNILFVGTGDLVAAEAVGIAGAVVALVVAVDDIDDRLRQIQFRQQLGPVLGVLAVDRPLGGIHLLGWFHQVVILVDQTDVPQQTPVG